MSSLFSLIKYLDQHSGSLLVTLTFVYIIGTFLMWWEMRRSRLKIDEPNIQVSLEPQARWGNFFDLVIENMGNVSVYNLTIGVEPSGLKTLGTRKLEDINLFKKIIPVFGKNKKIQTLAIIYPDFINSDQPKEIKFIVKYFNLNKKEFIQEFNFDMEVYRNMSASSESSLTDVVKEIGKLTKEVSDINSFLKIK